MVGGGPAMSTPSESMLEAVLFQRLSVADRQETVNEILQRLSETGSGSQWVGAVTLAARLLNVAPNVSECKSKRFLLFKSAPTKH